MTGFGVMCVNMSAIPYLTEISPAEARGKWQNLTAAVGMIGVPVVGVLCRIVLPLSTDAWRWVFYAGGAGVLLFFGAHRVLLESPRWLMARDRRAEAESVVREISGVDVELSQVKLEKGGVKPPLSEMLLGLFSREYIRTSLVVILPFLILGPATYIFQNWTTTLFKSQGFSLEDSLTITLFMQLGIPVGLFAFSYLSELGGRKLPIVISLFFMGFSGLAITFCTTLWEFCFVGFLIMGCIQGVVYTYLAYTSESFPTKIRNTGLAVLQARMPDYDIAFPARHSRFVRGLRVFGNLQHILLAVHHPGRVHRPLRQAYGRQAAGGNLKTVENTLSGVFFGHQQGNRQGSDMEAEP